MYATGGGRGRGGCASGGMPLHTVAELGLVGVFTSGRVYVSVGGDPYADPGASLAQEAGQTGLTLLGCRLGEAHLQDDGGPDDVQGAADGHRFLGRAPRPADPFHRGLRGVNVGACDAKHGKGADKYRSAMGGEGGLPVPTA